MLGRDHRIAALLFGSGACALIYEVVWLRELRLVFGASTPASAAVLAVFMGGLGFGALLLGRRADRAARPLRFYSSLELGVAASAAASPLLLTLVRAVYVWAGGSTTLGAAGGTVARLLLSALVLLPPTLMMGGTLPAAARAAVPGADASRRSTALVYGLNTLGAVTGAALSTFVLLEVFGARLTLWIAALINALLAVLARILDRSLAAAEQAAPAEEPAAPAAPAPRGVPAPFVLAAAAAVGFAFLLMELVWYRMLAPVLGGSSYTFGLILAAALLGIGAGGLFYTLRAAGTAVTVSAFAWSAALEALLLAVPYALGDRIALLALLLRPLGATGLAAQALGWALVTAIVVVPASIVAGYQFPLLIGLLGRGGAQLGRHVGTAYAANTFGSILGSLAGGFLLLPLLGALGAWKLAVWVLAAIAAAATVLFARTAEPRALASLSAVVGALALLHGATGPTAFFRHTPIGAGRADLHLGGATRNSLREMEEERRRSVSWEAEGREGSVALHTHSDTAFFVNGKSDGAALGDAGTQVMGGLLGALLHAQPVKEVLVIGLGTGSTAGWLAALPEVERVDVVELEPAILHVAEVCSPVNHDALRNPKIHVAIGDAREVLLTTKRHYDLVFSEPSNPYRAGISSLFTREFYEAVRSRLRPDGVFVQWLQGYEIDARSVRGVYATLGAVFFSVESWRSKPSDLVLLSRRDDAPIDVAELRRRVATSPYREALAAVWHADSAEDVLARFIARSGLARTIADRDRDTGVNTDDLNALEFGIARSLGKSHDFSVGDLTRLAGLRGEARPLLAGGGEAAVDWERVDSATAGLPVVHGHAPEWPAHARRTPEALHRLQAMAAWIDDRYDDVIAEWGAQKEAPRSLQELLVMADAFAVAGDEAHALPLLDRLAASSPLDADALRARLFYRLGRREDAFRALERAITGHRRNPWADTRIMGRTLPLALDLARAEPARIPALDALLREPLSMRHHDAARLQLRLHVAMLQKGSALCVDALAAYGQHPLWQRDFLVQRLVCYERQHHPLRDRAAEDLEQFTADEGPGLGDDLLPPLPPPGAMPASAAPTGSAAPAGSVAPVGSAAPSASVRSTPAASAP
jgi:spermidine synthase